MISRQAIVALLVLGLTAPAETLPLSSSSPDPYALNETAFGALAYTAYKDTSGKTLASQAVNTGVANLILIVVGQSNIDNMKSSSDYTPDNPNVLDNLNIYDGAIYKAVTPLLGTSTTSTSGGNYFHSALIVADALVTAGKFARVIVVPVAIGSTSVADWGGGTASGSDVAGGTLKTRIPVAIARLAQRGITCGATNVTCAILWGQGEADTFFTTSQANYVASFNAMVATVSAAGFVGRWFVAKQSYFSSATNATVQAAQAAVINNGAGIYLGANADALVGSICNGGGACRADTTHFSLDGGVAYATDSVYGWLQAMHASGAPY